MLTIDEISNLYVMYNELCSFNFQSKNWENTLKYFYKAQKYFNLVCEDLVKNTFTYANKINTFKNHFLSIKALAVKASEALGNKDVEENLNNNSLDEYEIIIFNENEKDIAYAKLSELLHKSNANISAINFLKKSLQINPNVPENYRLIGDYYSQLKEYKNAIAFYEKYNEFSPNNPLVYNSLGTLYSFVDKYNQLEKQIEYFKKALEILPDYKEALKNLAIAYRHFDKNEESVECYKKLIELDPSADNYFNYACQQLKLKNFKEGWKYFEHRFDKKTYPVVYPKLDKPKWTGKEDLKDKTLLIQYEQGFGDSIIFFRYLPQIKAKKIILRVQDGLVELFRNNSKNIEIVGKSKPIEELSFDFHVPFLSLPYILNAKIDNIPSRDGYIKADRKKVQEYKGTIFNNNCFKIGISWQGAKYGTEVKNIPLECFYPLTKIKNVKVYSFQKGDNLDELKKLPEGVEIIDIGETFNDFSDTAAAAENIDLFVTIDSVILNLAGAMNRPAFMLLNRDSDWRWFTDEETTPWYNSVRIFKKENELEPWDILIQKVINEITCLRKA